VQDRTGADGGRSETNDGETIIYDREQPTAWLQSDYTVPMV
jgi:hypothetical protein